MFSSDRELQRPVGTLRFELQFQLGSALGISASMSTTTTAAAAVTATVGKLDAAVLHARQLALFKQLESDPDNDRLLEELRHVVQQLGHFKDEAGESAVRLRTLCLDASRLHSPGAAGLCRRLIRVQPPGRCRQSGSGHAPAVC